ncbi:MAG: CvpA family protein [Desulfobacteraceae bacterium]|nr:MAG: CvpA family protein [Desulfobacteraceae bacterium]
MNPLDYVLALILGYCLVRGIFRGLIKELTSIIGVLGGFYFAFTYYPHMAKPLRVWVGGAGPANIIGFLILFVGVYLVISILGSIIKYLMNIAFLGWTDRVLGALFGALKGVLIVAVMIAMLTTFLPAKPIFLKGSLFVRHFNGISALMVRAASADIKSQFEIRLKELKKSWQSTGK